MSAKLLRNKKSGFNLVQLKKNQLPTSLNVIEAILFEKAKHSNPNLKDIYSTIASEIEEIWAQTCIQILVKRSIDRKVEQLFDAYRNALKSERINTQRNPMKEGGVINAFKSSMKNELFDIAQCKCVDIYNCRCGNVIHKLSKEEKDSLSDQRTERKMVFGQIDPKLTKLYQRRQTEKLAKSAKSRDNAVNANVNFYGNDEVEMDESQPISTEIKTTKLKLTNVGVVLNAYGASHRLGATICNALLKDMNVTSEESIIDPSKVRRAKQHVAEEATAYHLSKLKTFIDDMAAYGLFFDGRNDITFNANADFDTETNKVKVHPRMEKESHYALLIQPSDEFYTHLTPNGSKALNAAECILNKLHSDGISTAKLQFIGCDGTVFNTGHKSGIMDI